MNKKLIGILTLGLLLNVFTTSANVLELDKDSLKAAKKAEKLYKKQLKKLAKGTTTTESGLMYKITEQGTGDKPATGDMVKVHYTGTLVDGTKFDSSVDRGAPLPLKLGVGMVIKGWDEGIALLNEGSKAQLIIPGDLAYGERGSGKLIKPNETLVFDVELVEIMQVPPYNVDGMEPEETKTGLKIYRLNTADSAAVAPKAGQNVSVHYSGFLEDGTKFDSSWDRMSPFTFALGQGRVIKGWDEGIALLKVGERARLIIPSELGYGNRGAGQFIKPGATLVFDVELMDVK